MVRTNHWSLFLLLERREKCGPGPSNYTCQEKIPPALGTLQSQYSDDTTQGSPAKVNISPTCTRPVNENPTNHVKTNRCNCKCCFVGRRLKPYLAHFAVVAVTAAAKLNSCTHPSIATRSAKSKQRKRAWRSAKLTMK